MKQVFKLIIYLIRQLFESLFLIIRLTIERFLKPFWILLFLTIYAINTNWSKILNGLTSFGIPEYTLIKGYFELLFSWPVAISIIGLIFIFKFSQSVKIFLENLNFLKVGPVEAGQRQQPTTSKDIEEKVTENLEQQGITLTTQQLQQIDQAFQEKETLLTNKDKTIKYLLERAELFEFSYLTLSLVYNTKVALMWFYLQLLHSSTKENFINSYILPFNITDPLAEKEAIFNALLTGQLLEQNGSLFNVTEKGKRFLKYLGFNIND